MRSTNPTSIPNFFLLLGSHGATFAARRLRVLATDADTPVVAETTVRAGKWRETAAAVHTSMKCSTREPNTRGARQIPSVIINAKPSDGPDFLQALEVITEADGDLGTVVLESLASDPVLLSVKEPQWDVERLGVLQDAHDLLHLLGGETTGANQDKSTRQPTQARRRKGDECGQKQTSPTCEIYLATSHRPQGRHTQGNAHTHKHTQQRR